jgi:hypothetical protein
LKKKSYLPRLNKKTEKKLKGSSWKLKKKKLKERKIMKKINEEAQRLLEKLNEQNIEHKEEELKSEETDQLEIWKNQNQMKFQNSINR